MSTGQLPEDRRARTHNSIELVRKVSNRLFLAMGVLIAVFLVAVLVTLSNAGLPSSTLLLVFLAGQFGGYVSLQRRVKKLNEDDLELVATSWIYTALSPLVGGILAVVLYMVFVSELVTGQLFPSFEPDANAGNTHDIRMLFAHHGAGYVDYAKLMVWSFIAGFSEKFVINVIGTFTTEEGD